MNYFKIKCPVPKEKSAIADLLGPSALNEANENVRELVQSSDSPTSTPKKRGKYISYSPKHRADIGKYAVENGPAATVRKFKNDFPTLNESTVRGMRKKYEDSRRSRKRKLDVDSEVTETWKAIPRRQ